MLRVLSPTVVLDLVALWPLAVLGLLVILVLLPGRRRRGRPTAGLMPLVLLLWLIGGVALHLLGWAALPSAAATVTATVAPGASARSVITSAGTVELAAAPGTALPGRADPARRPFHRTFGVGAGVGESLTVRIGEFPDPGWFRYAGWKVALSPETGWDLDVTADILTLDLTGLRLTSLTVAGSGEVRLPEAAGPTAVEVSGSVVISIPQGTPAEVVGPAMVPDGWTQTEGGASSTGGGEGWRIVVGEDAEVAVQEH